MKAVTKLAPREGAMELIDVEPPQRKPGEVLVRITAGGVCGTDCPAVAVGAVVAVNPQVG